MKKLIFIDVDGTLLNEYQQVPSSAQEAVKAAVQAGHELYLSTGRSKPEIYPWLWDLGFKGMVAAAGAYTHNGIRLLSDKRIPESEIARITTVFQDNGIEWVWQGPEVFYMSENYVASFLATHSDEAPSPWLVYKEQVEPYIQYVPAPTASKATFIIPESATITIAEVQQAVGNQFEAFAGSYRAGIGTTGEIVMRGTSKATGMAAIAATTGVDIEHTIAIGDSHNDLEALQAAGIGVAMGDSPDHVKQAADLVTGSLAEDGLAAALAELKLV